MAPSVPATVDERLLTIYLTNHLTAATGVVQRLGEMESSYRDLSIHDDIAHLARAIAGETERLRELVRELGLSPRRHHQALAKAGELVGRLKLNGRIVSRSPLTPLLEMELLRTGVTGKMSLWQVLQGHSAELGLDRAELEHLEQQAAEQLDVIQRCRDIVAGTAFSHD